MHMVSGYKQTAEKILMVYRAFSSSAIITGVSCHLDVYKEPDMYAIILILTKGP
jgi:hypothetical protein